MTKILFLILLKNYDSDFFKQKWGGMVIDILIGFLLSFLSVAILVPLFIKIMKKKNAGQNILGYVTMHSDKQGTPTMGGIILFLVFAVLCFSSLNFSTFFIFTISVALAYSLVGFLDDFLKIKNKQNLGLLPYQKIIGQVGISAILSFYVYFYSGMGGNIIIPFTMNVVDIGCFIIPLTFLVSIAITNSVNLSDGLDGLASSVSKIFFIAIFIIIIIIKNYLFSAGYSDEIVSNYSSLLLICSIIIGSLYAFLLYNTNKASVFMGDVGSLGLGGLMASVCAVSGLQLFIPIIGIMFVLSSTSVILQVFYYKHTKKRIFLMSPLHHHFQMKGYSEAKIVYGYKLVTIFLSIILILFALKNITNLIF